MGTYRLVTPMRGLSPLLQEWADKASPFATVRLYEGSNCDVCGAVNTTCMNDHGVVPSTGDAPPTPAPAPVVQADEPGEDNGERYTPAVAQPEFQDG